VDRRTEGAARETQARGVLERAGQRTLGCNVRYRVGELDLVMLDREVLVFVEVRYRREHDFGGALASVTQSKQAKLARAAASFLARHPQHAQRACRFDVVAIGDTGADWVRDAFRMDAW
jgi:putative endonuclease